MFFLEEIIGARGKALEILKASIEAADSCRAVKNHIRLEDDILWAGETSFNINDFENIYIVGAGKASARMALACEEVLGGRLGKGIVVVKEGHGERLQKVEIREAGHPIPDERGYRAATEIVKFLSGTKEKDLVLCLISGGGSAMLALPSEGVSLEDKRETTQLLLHCGATIREINAVRKHLSRIKGGKLARYAYPSHLIALILSDVIGDDLGSIASGLTVPDDTSYEDALFIFKKYGLQDNLPSSVLRHITDGVQGKIEEAPKRGDPLFNKVTNVLVGNNLLALNGAKKKAESLGYNALILTSGLSGEARVAAKVLASILKEVAKSQNPLGQPASLIAGGETTVTLKGDGLGGRNTEFALAAANEIDGQNGLAILSCGTDGTDGPTPAAGAIVDGTTVSRARQMGLSPTLFLEKNDSYNFFKKLGDLIITGPTRTNMMDIAIMVAEN